MTLESLFESFNGKRVLVVGDVMTDAYLHGVVNRMSPEAPVPVLDFKSDEKRIGGAGNVALNLQALGATPLIASVIGLDQAGSELLSLFRAAQLDTSAIITAATRRTTIKTRVLSNSKQLLRIDTEDQHDLNEQETSAIQAAILQHLAQGIDGIILEDYNKGVLSETLISWIIAQANSRNIPTCVDPKKKNFLSYRNCTLFKPNLKELQEGLALNFDYNNSPESIDAALALLHKNLGNQYTFVTLSEHGVQLFDGQNHWRQAAHLRNIADVSGAGDTVIATASLCLICKATAQQIAAIANLAGGLVCESPGVVSINKKHLLEEALQKLS
ncbi:MAG: bifunctional heptose 7-phosphate kinase/heptose 1-phosphate adenyltransferase [Flavobacteriales bacterium]